MTKEEFIKRWKPSHMVITDLDSVITNEIEKAKVQPQPSDKVQISKHTLVEVNRAFRALKQDRNSYIHKVFSDDGVFDAMEEIRQVHELHYGPKKEEQPKLDPIEAWKQYKEENKPQPALNPIEKAYHAFQPIRYILWKKGWRIKKHSDTESIDGNGKIYKNTCFVFDFDKNPEEWELYTEPEQVSELTEQPKHNVLNEQFSDVHHKIVDGLGTILSSLGGNSGIMSIVMSWGDTQDSVSTLQMLDDYIEKFISKQPAQPSSQVKLDNSFDKDRFERIFCAIVASGKTETWEQDFKGTIKTIEKLDAYYASKKGGNNE